MNVLGGEFVDLHLSNFIHNKQLLIFLAIRANGANISRLTYKQVNIKTFAQSLTYNL